MQRMRYKIHILLVLLIVLFAIPITALAGEQSARSKEYQVKAAFLYNFIKFVDWPEEKVADSNEPMVIGVIGSKDFIKAFENVKGKRVKDRSVIVKYFEGFEESKKSKQENDSEQNRNIKALGKCHVVMFCTCDSTVIKNRDEIIEALKDTSVLIVGEMPGFIEAGGIINFLMEDKKVRFEINLDAANEAKLKIRSKLIRLAKRVISEKSSEKDQDG